MTKTRVTIKYCDGMYRVPTNLLGKETHMYYTASRIDAIKTCVWAFTRKGAIAKEDLEIQIRDVSVF
ncbi:MAG: hypothetical protein KAT00_15160 [Planctomycetes bacterium]|nr:hypothetical protein [Planctomycetota bacterium]